MNDDARTAEARKARRITAARRRHEKWVAELREWGWECTPPDVYPFIPLKRDA